MRLWPRCRGRHRVRATERSIVRIPLWLVLGLGLNGSVWIQFRVRLMYCMGELEDKVLQLVIKFRVNLKIKCTVNICVWQGFSCSFTVRVTVCF